MNNLTKTTAVATILLLLLSTRSLAQSPPKDPITGKYTYEAVVQVDSVNSTLLFERASNWYELEFKTGQLNLKNQEDKKLSHRGSFPIVWTYKSFKQEDRIDFTVSLECREGRYRYVFTEFMVTSNSGHGDVTVTLESYQYGRLGKIFDQKVMPDILAQVDAHVQRCLRDLQAMVTGEVPYRDKW